MQKLIDSWRKQAKLYAKSAKYVGGSSFVIVAKHLRSCAKQLSKVNTFKFCVGDKVLFGASPRTIEGYMLVKSDTMHQYLLSGYGWVYENQLSYDH